MPNVALASMTGFARQDGGDDDFSWTWEVKSVNGRSLEMRCRLPFGQESLEAAIRSLVAKYVARGNLQISLTMNQAAGVPTLRINRRLLDELVLQAKEIAAEHGLEPPRVEFLLSLRGVIEQAESVDDEERRSRREEAELGDLDLALAKLLAVRREEGAHLGEAAGRLIDEISALYRQACECAAAQPQALRARLERQLEDLLAAQPPLPEDRLVQEAALLASKADIREELDRLAAHLSGARSLLEEGSVVGRRLDFLCQELNREANTICSKSQDVDLTRIGLAIKGAIEQLREQVQNIE